MATLTAATCFAVNGQYLMAAGCFTGLLLTPDLDTDDGSLADYFTRGAGRLVYNAWWLYWWLYRKLPHRSFLSHAPIVSTLIRIGYAFWWLFFLGYHLPPEFLIGLMTADILHYLMDLGIFRRIWK